MKLFLAWLGLAIVALAASPENLRCEYLTNPLGIDTPQPRLSWNIISSQRGERQAAYQILVASSAERLAQEHGDLWDSGKVMSDRSVLIPYAGSPLSSRQGCWWKVRVWNQQDKASVWSHAGYWEMGLLTPEAWQPAKWIGLAQDTRQSPLASRVLERPRPAQAQSFPAPMFRRVFQLKPGVTRARVYVCGLGYHEVYVNGQRMGDQVLDPGQTTYDVRAFYVTHDVTAAVKSGDNAVGIYLGNGFYGQNIGFSSKGLCYGPPVLLARLVVDYRDGSTEIVGTDDSWKAETGPVLFDNVYAGETYDAQCERPGWNQPGYDDAAWQKPSVVPAPTPKLQAQMIPPIRHIRTLKPVQVMAGGKGKWIFDLGQNIAGWVRLKPNLPTGTMITMRFGEELAEDGRQINFESTGVKHTFVKQTDIYVCKGVPGETWEPRFTYHGFRYVEVEGLTAQPALDLLEGVLVRTAVEPRGTFECSNELLNRIYRTSLWTIEDNLHSVPEDCPHRERCAWLGDAHCTAETGIFNFDMAAFWTKFMGDVETVLGKGGMNYLKRPATPGIPCNIAVGRRLCQEARPDWGVAVVFVPWFIYNYYGDTQILAEHYPLMKRWVNYVNAHAENSIIVEGYGDWCPPGSNSKMECPVPLSSTAYQYGAWQVMEQVARLLGKTDDAAEFGRQAQITKTAFLTKFFDPQTHGFGSQTADALALRFGLVPAGQIEALANDLARCVTEQHDGHAFVGIHGGRSLFTELDRYGHSAVVFTALTQTNAPSYGYNLSVGLTTWPEVPAPQPAGRSLNHPMQSGFAAWFHESLAGIRPLAPGFKRIAIQPHGFAELAWVKAEHISPYGPIISNWKRDGNQLTMDVTIPANTTAEVYVPAANASAITESGQPAVRAEGVKFLRTEKDATVFAVESGPYQFCTRWKAE